MLRQTALRLLRRPYVVLSAMLLVLGTGLSHRGCHSSETEYRDNNKSLVVNGSTSTVLHSSGRRTARKDNSVVPAIGRMEDTASKPIYVPPEGHIEITPRRDIRLREGQEVLFEDLVDIKYKTWGLTFRPGLAVSTLPLALGLDAKLVYVSRAGINVGLVGGKEDMRRGSLWISPTATFSYRLDTKLTKNTELFVGYLPLSPLIVPITGGIRINL